MADPSWSFQKALYAALVAALENVSPQIARVYDAVPQRAAYPYVTLDTQIAEDLPFLSDRKDGVLFYLNVWSTYAGQKQVLDIMAAIGTALHERKLVLEVGRNARTRVIRRRTVRDADGQTFQGQVTVRAWNEHA